MHQRTLQKPLKTSSKVCTKCGGRKPLTDFRKCRNGCKQCEKADTYSRRKNNPEYRRAHDLKYYRTHTTQCIEAAKAQYRKDPVRVKNRLRKKYHIEVYGKEVPILEMSRDRFRVARSLGFRSGLEVQIAKQLDDNHIPYEYEGTTFKYLQPEEFKRLTPDFILPNFIIVESKGEWVTADRKKVKLFLSQNPDVDYRMVFSRSASRISKTSKTTYADVCKTLGIKFADKWIPLSWLSEPINLVSKAAIEKAKNAN